MSQRVRKGLANWLTSSSTPIFVLDHRRVILVFNQGCEALTGWNAAEVIGKTCVLVTRQNPEEIESLTGVLAPPERVLQGEFATLPAVISTVQGAQTFEISFFPLPQEGSDDPARVMGIIGPLKDAGIELVLDSQVRRFDLATVLAELYERHQLETLVAKSPVMQRVATQVEVARMHQHPVHFSGEKGAGKEYLARLIHYASPSRDQRFLALDCKSLPHFEVSRTLRRLFAETPEESRVGTVYLKHIDNLAKDLQVELFDHLEASSHFRWMSSSEPGVDSIPTEVLHDGLKSRLTAFQIALPALRERREDLLLLATYYLEIFNQEQGKQVEELSLDVEAELLAYSWPGNISELVLVVEAMVQRCSGTVAQLEDFNLNFKAGRDAQRLRPVRLHESLESFLDRIERERIVETLALTRGNKAAAAERLQIPRPKLYRRMTALMIQDETDQAGETS